MERPFWITRDVDAEGKLSETVDVWSVRPTYKPLPGGTGGMYLGPGETGIEHRTSQMTLGEARKLTPPGTLPESYLEVIKVD